MTAKLGGEGQAEPHTHPALREDRKGAMAWLDILKNLKSNKSLKSKKSPLIISPVSAALGWPAGCFTGEACTLTRDTNDCCVLSN